MLRRKALEEFAAWRDEHGNRALFVTGACNTYHFLLEFRIPPIA